MQECSRPKITREELRELRSIGKEIKELRAHLANARDGGLCFCSEKYSQMLRERIQALEEIHKRLLCSVEQIEDSRLRRVVMMRYAYGWSWQKIAFQIDASSESTPRLLLSRALERMCDKSPDK